MASLKYGCISPNPKGREYPVAASQYFPHASGAFVYLDGSGHVTMAITATATLFGYAITPAGRGAGASDSYWLSSATAGADKLFVITDLANALFAVPATTTVTAAMAGNAGDIVGVNDGTVQQADTDTSTTDVLLVQGVATDFGAGYAATDAVVKINPLKVQADT
jgi:hypothetical protein